MGAQSLVREKITDWNTRFDGLLTCERPQSSELLSSSLFDAVGTMTGVEMTGDSDEADYAKLPACTIIASTPEKFEYAYCRPWHV